MLQTAVNPKVLNLSTVLEIHCPNCGDPAQRYYLAPKHLTRTQCPTCDYLMVTCSQTGRVVEAYAPGIYARR